MADEVAYTIRLAVSKGGTSVANATQAYVVDMAGDQMFHGNPAITTTAALLSVAPVDATARYRLFMRNQDATNEVLVSYNGGTTYPNVIPPGEAMLVIVTASQTLWLDAVTATCIVEVAASEI